MLSEAQSKEIEELSGLFFNEEEIEEITGLNRTLEGWNKAFRRGALMQEAELRKSIISLAKDGSSPAQTMAWSMLQNQKRQTY